MEEKINIIKRIVALNLVALLLLGVSAQIGSARTLEDINRELEEASKQRGELQRQEGDLVTQLVDTDRRLGVLQADIDILNDQLKVVQRAKAETESELFKKQAELTVAEEKLAKQTSVLEKRLVDVYKRGSVGYLELLVGAADLNDLLSRLYYLGRIVTQDKKLLLDIKETKEKVEEERDTCEAKRQEILARQRAIEDIKKPLDIKQREIEEEKNYKKSLLSQVELNQEAKDQLIAELLREQQEIYGRARGRGGGGTAPSGFIWPVSGEITGWFGEPRPGHLHSGIDIAADYNTPVVAVASGTVDYAGYGSGYGNHIQIYHGGGISTLYAHLNWNGIWVNSGDTITQGQVIGLVGSTGNSTGPHLHFEVIINGEPVDPLSYLP